LYLSSNFAITTEAFVLTEKKRFLKNQELICTREIKLYRQMCCVYRIVQEEEGKNVQEKHTHTHTYTLSQKN